MRTHVTYNNNGRVQSSIAGYDNSALQQATTYTWLSNGMALNGVVDASSGVFEGYQYDAIGRKIVENTGIVYFGLLLRSTTKTYYDEDNKVLIKEDLKTADDQKLQTIVHSDQMGRVILEQYSDGAALNVNDSNDGVKVKTIYQHFSGGSRVITSSPYRLTLDATLEWKCRQPPKTPNSALRSLTEMLIYLCVNSAFGSVASLDFGLFGACLYAKRPGWPRNDRGDIQGRFSADELRKHDESYRRYADQLQRRLDDDNRPCWKST